MMRLYFNVRTWQRVQATLLTKEIYVHKKISSANSPFGIRVNYAYQFNQQSYNGNHVYLTELAGGQVNHMKSLAEKKIKELSDQMLIYVNPQQPEQSVIYCKGIGLYGFILFMGVFSLIIGVSYLLK